MTTEYGGTYGGQPRPPTPPPYRAQPPPPRRRSSERVRWFAVVAAMVVGVAGLVVALPGVTSQLLPRRFSAQQQREITDWETGKLWRVLPAGQIFPASVVYPAPSELADDPALRLTDSRVGISRQGSCAGATDAAVGSVLNRVGCEAMLRATYADGTDSYVITVGVAAMGGSTAAGTAARELAHSRRAGGTAGVAAMPVKGTPAAAFTNSRRQLSGSVLAGPYLVFYTVGYADGRPRVPVAADHYADEEMTDAGRGVAQKVRSEIDPPMSAPRCPGVPGC